MSSGWNSPPCWLFMAWFHIHLSAPSHQMGLRIYAFLQQWCYQSGKLPLDGRRDNKKGYTTGSIPQHSFVFSQQHKCVTEIEALEPDGKKIRSCKKKKKNFCRFNFVSISWKSNFGCMWSGHLWLFWDSPALCLRSAAAAVRSNIFFFPPLFDFFFVVVVVIFFSLVYAGHRHQGGAGSHTALALQSWLNS